MNVFPWHLVLELFNFCRASDCSPNWFYHFHPLPFGLVSQYHYDTIPPVNDDDL